MFPESPEWILQIVAAIATGILTLLATVWGLRHGAQKSGSGSLGKVFWLIPAAGLVAVIAQALTAVAHHNYNSELVLRYGDKFSELKEERVKAASAIYTYLRLHDWDAVSDADLDGLDDVLDFLDELGFYWQHGQISAPVLYEHFYDYFRIYYRETGGYVTAQRAADAPTIWQNISPLFDELTRIEAKKLHCSPAACKWDTETLEESLKIEMRANSSRSRAHTPPHR